MDFAVDQTYGIVDVRKVCMWVNGDRHFSFPLQKCKSPVTLVEVKRLVGSTLGVISAQHLGQVMVQGFFYELQEYSCTNTLVALKRVATHIIIITNSRSIKKLVYV